VQYVLYSAQGNRFILVPTAPDNLDSDGPELVHEFFDCPTPMQADGLLLLGSPTQGPTQVTIFNADGSPGGFSGNGLRCAAHALLRERAPGEVLHLSMGRNRVRATLPDPQDYRLVEIHIEGSPLRELSDVTSRVEPKLLDDAAGCNLTRVWAVDVGNPHLLLFTGRNTPTPCPRIMEQLRRDSVLLTGGINVSIVTQTDRCLLELITHERGVGPTPSCASAALAAFLALGIAGLIDESCRVRQSGGELLFRQDDTGVCMVGFVDRLEEGHIHGRR